MSSRWKRADDCLTSSRCAEYYIAASHKISSVTANVPSWVWFLVLPAMTQGIVKWLFFGADEGGAARRPGQGLSAAARAPGAVPVARKNA